MRQFVACDNRSHFHKHNVGLKCTQLMYCYAQLSCFTLLLQATENSGRFFLPVVLAECFGYNTCFKRW